MPEEPSVDAEVAIEAKGLGIAYRRYLYKVTTLKQAMVGMFRGSKYQSFWAVRGFDLTVKRGERIGIIGRNGSGKSTLLKAIAGVLPATEGTIRTRGRIAPLLELGAGFRPDLTGRENIFLNGAILGLSRQQMEERFDGIVAFAEIGDFIDAPLASYSSGMKARLGFAVSTDVDPDILLLDEILSVGDAGFKKKAIERAKAFFAQGRSVVLVSHSMSHVRQVCDRVIYMSGGRIVAEGEPEEIIDRYLTDVDGKK